MQSRTPVPCCPGMKTGSRERSNNDTIAMCPWSMDRWQQWHYGAHKSFEQLTAMVCGTIVSCRSAEINETVASAYFDT